MQDYMVMLQEYVPWALANFGLMMFVLAVFFAILHKLVCFRRVSVSEAVYRWMAFFAVGVTAIYAFIMHAFYSDFTAAVIGWQNTPFQFEVAIANLAFGLMAILSFRASCGFRLATILGVTCWLWGDAVGHIFQMITQNNFTIGNAGSWFWLDILVPFVLILCIPGLKRANAALTNRVVA